MRPKILVVDDRKDNRVVLKHVLSELKVQVVEADSGEEALRLCLSNEFCLALVDVDMPSMDGYETVSLIHDHGPTRNLPVIFLTAHMSDDLKVYRGYECGAVDYMTKPLNSDILLAKVNVFLQLDAQRRNLLTLKELEEEVAEERKKMLDLAHTRSENTHHLTTMMLDNLERPYSHFNLHIDAGLESIESLNNYITLTGHSDPKLSRLLARVESEMNRIATYGRGVDLLNSGIAQYFQTEREIASKEKLDIDVLISTVLELLEPIDTKNNVHVEVGSMPSCTGYHSQLLHCFIYILRYAICALDGLKNSKIEIRGIEDLEQKKTKYTIELHGLENAKLPPPVKGGTFFLPTKQGLFRDWEVTVLNMILSPQGGKVVFVENGESFRFDILMPMG